MNRLKAGNVYPIITGIVFLSLSAAIFAFDNPFIKNEVGTIMTTSRKEKETKNIEETDSGEKKIYGTKYGDKITENDEKKIIDPLLDSLFNVSYRSVKTNPDDFKGKVIASSGYVFTDYERDDEGVLINDPVSPVTFAERLMSAYADNDVEMNVTFNPQYVFNGDYGDTYVNGELSVTFFSGKDITDISKLFAIDNPEINKTYSFDCCIGYTEKEDKTYKLTDLVHKYVEPSEIYGK